MDGNIKAIELQGIVHNETKIGVKDGQCEDLVNLRFKDGSWRTSGDGKLVYNLTDTYEELYVHTNVYRHLLGVKYADTTKTNGTLYWVANIIDGVFESLAKPIEITSVVGKVTITQTGHLITIIDGGDDFKYFVFKKSTVEYKKVDVYGRGEKSDRGLYPLGAVHFNLYSPLDEPDKDMSYVIRDETFGMGPVSSNIPSFEFCHDKMIKIFEEAEKRNRFTRPFLACAAVELYDGSYAFATNPVLLWPRQRLSRGDKFYSSDSSGSSWKNTGDNNRFAVWRGDDHVSNHVLLGSNKYEDHTTNDGLPVMCNGTGANTYTMELLTSDLVFSIDDKEILENNRDIFSAVCVFITQESNVYDLKELAYKNSPDYLQDDTAIHVAAKGTYIYSYFPPRRTIKQIEYDLVHSSFYLYKRYTKEEIGEIISNPVITNRREEDEGILYNINRGTLKDILTSETIDRKAYVPEVSYLYNGRLHIANYKTYASHGYPIEMFMDNNHSVEVEDGTYENGVLSNLKFSSNDSIHQGDLTSYRYFSQYWLNQGEEDSDRRSADSAERQGFAIAYIRTRIETDDGDQYVVRYVPFKSNMLYDDAEQRNPIRIEDLNPFISFPDHRAKEMSIYIRYIGSDGCFHSIYGEDSSQQYINIKLKPHPYLNIAYCLSDEVRPISISNNITLSNRGDFQFYDDYLLVCPEEQNIVEEHRNTMKVSRTGNPMLFPVEFTYQVGSSEIVGMCSNSIAVGTGQTGDAPLYVFCKDGVYALMVDSSGEMAYTNARIIARDVCNNGKSVTPIDSGVVFTTDRGLMCIAGDQVAEIGQPLEGDYADFCNSNKLEYNMIAKNAYTMTKISSLPIGSKQSADFLEYLKGAIVNYNHNERELMVSNIGYAYTYVLDRNGNWSRRDFSAAEYVNNYPTSYRVESGSVYQVDEENDADNGTFIMTREIKLDSIGFKEVQRVVARGLFETAHKTIEEQKTLYMIPNKENGTVVDNVYSVTNKTISECTLEMEEDGFIVSENPLCYTLSLDSSTTPNLYYSKVRFVLSNDSLEEDELLVETSLVRGDNDNTFLAYFPAGKYNAYKGENTIKVYLTATISNLNSEEETETRTDEVEEEAALYDDDNAYFIGDNSNHDCSFGFSHAGTTACCVSNICLTITSNITQEIIVHAEVYYEGGGLLKEYSESIYVLEGEEQQVVFDDMEFTTNVPFLKSRCKVNVYAECQTSEALVFSASSVIVTKEYKPKYHSEIRLAPFIKRYEKKDNNYLGIYVFGSYDARRWSLMGHNEKTRTFTDIGCKVERSDMKFYRLVLAGQLTKDSRLDYFEFANTPSKLNTKTR